MTTQTHSGSPCSPAFGRRGLPFDPSDDLVGNMVVAPDGLDPTPKRFLGYCAWNRLVEVRQNNGGQPEVPAASENKAQPLLERNEDVCALFIRRAKAEKDFKYFGESTSICHGESGNDWQ